MTTDSASVGAATLTAFFGSRAGSACGYARRIPGEVLGGIVAGNVVAIDYGVVARSAALMKPTAGR